MLIKLLNSSENFVKIDWLVQKLSLRIEKRWEIKVNNDFPIWRQFIQYNDDEQKYEKCFLALKEKFEFYSGKYLSRNRGIQKWFKNLVSSGRKWENLARVNRWFNCFSESNLKPRDHERRLTDQKECCDTLRKQIFVRPS